jgi:hypothetical protein
MVSCELARVVRDVAVSPGDVQAERYRLDVVIDDTVLRGSVGCRLSAATVRAQSIAPAKPISLPSASR